MRAKLTLSECVKSSQNQDCTIVRPSWPEEDVVSFFSLWVVGGIAIPFPSMLLALGPLEFKHRDVKALLGAVSWDIPLSQADSFKYLREAQKLCVGCLGGCPFI